MLRLCTAKYWTSVWNCTCYNAGKSQGSHLVHSMHIQTVYQTKETSQYENMKVMKRHFCQGATAEYPTRHMKFVRCTSPCTKTLESPRRPEKDSNVTKPARYRIASPNDPEKPKRGSLSRRLKRGTIDNVSPADKTPVTLDTTGQRNLLTDLSARRASQTEDGSVGLDSDHLSAGGGATDVDHENLILCQLGHLLLLAICCLDTQETSQQEVIDF